jgi:two-component system nitrogen regulation sensor histidine kinase NtrY
MVFKNFRFQTILRVLILTACIILFAWCIVHERYLRSIYLGVAVIVILVEFVWYVDRFNRDVKMFMLSLLQRDFTTYYQQSSKGKSFDELYNTLNDISVAFQTISAEKETQHRYLEMLVEHIRVGVLSFDSEGKVSIANQALKKLFGITVITNVKTFKSIDENFAKTIEDIRTGETKLIKVKVNSDLLQLSMHASEVKLQDHYYKLISIQNIRNELDNREMEAWQKLIRVLSHEIMNSVAPITSLSSTLHGMVRKENETNPDGIFESLDKGLEAIKLRSEGLFNFTQTYKKLTGIPKLSLKQVDLNDVFSRIQLLMENKIKEGNITLSIGSADHVVTIDPELMEHVLINLILNAIEAVKNSSDPRIQLTTSSNARGTVTIHVTDNGEGMDEQTAEKIFIPFFTTRKEGSGIGLAITKQILQLHHADIRFRTERGQGTEFMITL